MHDPMLFREHPAVEGGFQWVYAFDNLYGASVVSLPPPMGTAGKFEVAVMSAVSGEVLYDTPITNDVVANVTIDEVEEILDQIEKLPRREDGEIHGDLSVE